MLNYQRVYLITLKQMNMGVSEIIQFSEISLKKYSIYSRMTIYIYIHLKYS